MRRSLEDSNLVHDLTTTVFHKIFMFQLTLNEKRKNYTESSTSHQSTKAITIDSLEKTVPPFILLFFFCWNVFYRWPPCTSLFLSRVVFQLLLRHRNEKRAKGQQDPIVFISPQLQEQAFPIVFASKMEMIHNEISMIIKTQCFVGALTSLMNPQRFL